jgi:hypothetical protein
VAARSRGDTAPLATKLHGITLDYTLPRAWLQKARPERIVFSFQFSD